MKSTFVILLILSSFNFFAQDQKSSSTKELVIVDSINQHWHHLDLKKDSIPGISLHKAYKELLVDIDTARTVIVALLDTKLDYTHEDLYKNIWLNSKEIPANKIDDDSNGYVDDINGWNFLGSRNNEDLLYQHSAALRYILKTRKNFQSKGDTILQKRMAPNAYQTYLTAKAQYKTSLENIIAEKKMADSLNTLFYKGRDTLIYYFKNKNFSISNIDSLLTKHPALESDVFIYKMATLNNITEDIITDQSAYYNAHINYILNEDYQERSIVNDNPDDIEDHLYGNAVIDGDVPFQHATSVAGILAARRGNLSGALGISDNIKIMPVVMVASGDEYDKDVAVAIRYAVDNGAKVINMSWGKHFSSKSNWVKDAFLYAQKNDVLIVKAAGNNNENVDTINYYPLDYTSSRKEFVDNLLVVGASTKDLKNLKASFSSYGKQNVDIFAPGKDLYTTATYNSYEYSSGTSLASPIVAGVAALIRSYYPEFSAVQVKNILMNSATQVDATVNLSTKTQPDNKIPFHSLSKSGGIVNAYQALLLAQKMSKR